MNIKLQDTLRAMYFINFLELMNHRLGESLKKYSKNPQGAILPVLQSLAEEADRITLGALPFEVRQARRRRVLAGATPFECYQSFFFNGDRWTGCAKSIPIKYPRLVSMLESLFSNATCNVVEMLERLKRERAKIWQVFNISPNDQIREIRSLDGDPHNKGRIPFLIEFESGSKLVYKPTSLEAYSLVVEVAKLLEFQPPYQLKFPKMLSGEDYGWIEWIDYQSCRNEGEIFAHFKNKGALLLLAYILGFNDGHVDNVIAVGQQTVITDGETWFQNHSATRRSNNSQYSVLDSYLIADPSRLLDDEATIAAFQATRSLSLCKSSESFALQERTPYIRTGYGVIKTSQNANLPILNGKVIGAGGYVEAVINGFLYAKDMLKARKVMLLNNNELWYRIALSRARFIARPTKFYLYARNMTRRPECLVGESQTRRMLGKLFAPGFEVEPRTRVFNEYEVEALLEGDVPIFHAVVGEPHLYDGAGRCYKNFFPEPALTQVRRNIEEIPRVEEQASIIRRALTITY